MRRVAARRIWEPRRSAGNLHRRPVSPQHSRTGPVSLVRGARDTEPGKMRTAGALGIRLRKTCSYGARTDRGVTNFAPGPVVNADAVAFPPYGPPMPGRASA